MKNACKLLVLALITLGVRKLSAQDVSYAPLLLYTNGVGKIVPARGGDMLEAGRKYVMTAVPDPGNVFVDWNLMVLFTVTGEEIDYQTGTIIPFTYTAVSPLPPSSDHRELAFTMLPEQVFTESFTNGTTVYSQSITEDVGWQANFEPAGTSP